MNQAKNNINNEIIKFSVIIPVYNVGKYLRDALNCLVNQTYSNFEAICVNDGSTDNSLEILKEYSNKDKRFVVITQENQGQGIARNKAIDIANGDYILFLDPDDLIETDTLEVLLQQIKAHKDVDIIQFDYITLTDNPRKNRIKSFKKQARKFLKFNLKNNQIYNWKDFQRLDLSNIGIAVWNKVYSSEFIKNNSIKFAPAKHGEDHIFSIKSTVLAKKILYINNVLYHYRIRSNSSAVKMSDDNFCIFENIKYVKDFLTEQNLLEELNKSYRLYLINVLSRHYMCISFNRQQEYTDKVTQILTQREYKLFLKKNNGKFSFVENLFSIKNQNRNGRKVKILRILGKTFEISKK